MLPWISSPADRWGCNPWNKVSDHKVMVSLETDVSISLVPHIQKSTAKCTLTPFYSILSGMFPYYVLSSSISLRSYLFRFTTGKKLRLKLIVIKNISLPYISTQKWFFIVANNYRCVSLLSSSSKTFDKCVNYWLNAQFGHLGGSVKRRSSGTSLLTSLASLPSVYIVSREWTSSAWISLILAL